MPKKQLVAGDVLSSGPTAAILLHTLAEGDLLANGDARIALTRKWGPGDRVFRVRSRKAAFKDDALAPKVPVQGRAVLRIGEPLRLELVASDGSFGSRRPRRRRPHQGCRRKTRCAHISTGSSNEPLPCPARRRAFSRYGKVSLLAAPQGARPGEPRTRGRPARRLPRPHPAQGPSTPACARGPGGFDRHRGLGDQRRLRPRAVLPADVVYVPAVNYKRAESLVAGQILDGRPGGLSQQGGHRLPRGRPRPRAWHLRGALRLSTPGATSRPKSWCSPKASPSSGGQRDGRLPRSGPARASPSTPGPSTCSKTFNGGSRPNSRSARSSRSAPALTAEPRYYRPADPPRVIDHRALPAHEPGRLRPQPHRLRSSQESLPTTWLDRKDYDAGSPTAAAAAILSRCRFDIAHTLPDLIAAAGVRASWSTRPCSTRPKLPTPWLRSRARLQHRAEGQHGGEAARHHHRPPLPQRV